MTAEFQYLSDEQLLAEIKRQWSDKAAWDAEKLQQYGSRRTSLADDYFGDDVEHHITQLENAYKARGLELPDRWANDCPTCGSNSTKWINPPPKGQIGSGPADFRCLACGREWSEDGREDEEE